MAVMYVPDWKKVLDAYKVSNHNIEALTLSGIKVVFSKTAMKFVKSGEVLSSVKVALDSVTKSAETGKASTLKTKARVQQAVTIALGGGDFPIATKKGGGGAMSKLHDKLSDVMNDLPDGLVVPANWQDQAEDAVFDAYAAVPEHVEAHKEPVKGLDVSTLGTFGEFSGSLSSTPTMKLSEATKLYQPVRGTGDTSRYFLMAANPDLKVGVRYQGHTLSVRIEGDLKKYRKSIESCGVTGGGSFDANDYVSMHLDVTDLQLASKTLGAVLIGLGIDFRTPMPKLQKILKEGA